MPADAVAPYHPTAVGVYSRLPRQPQPASNRDINTAYVYAVYTYFQTALPQFDSRWRRMMKALDLDPDDTSLCAAGATVCSPIEIGNTAARIAIAARANDGMNRDGNITRKYNPMPFEDYTSYMPVNTAYTLADASRWQPANQRQRYGVYKIQQVQPLQPCHPRVQLGTRGADDVPVRAIDVEGAADLVRVSACVKALCACRHVSARLQFVTAYWELVEPFAPGAPQLAKFPPPVKSDPRNGAAYRKQVDEVLAASAALTPKQKGLAEWFDQKVRCASSVIAQRRRCCETEALCSVASRRYVPGLNHSVGRGRALRAERRVSPQS